jgi:hypothetical protein
MKLDFKKVDKAYKKIESCRLNREETEELTVRLSIKIMSRNAKKRIGIRPGKRWLKQK